MGCVLWRCDSEYVNVPLVERVMEFVREVDTISEMPTAYEVEGVVCSQCNYPCTPFS